MLSNAMDVQIRVKLTNVIQTSQQLCFGCFMKDVITSTELTFLLHYKPLSHTDPLQHSHTSSTYCSVFGSELTI